MTYNSRNWKHWGIAISALLSWALEPVFFFIFINLNWENILPVTGFLVLTVTDIVSDEVYFTYSETEYMLFCMGQFFGTGVLMILSYFSLDKLLKHVPFFTFEGEKERRAQEKKNRIKFYEVQRNTLTLETIELLKKERERDRRLILEMRESLRNLKLEVEALRENKPNISNKSDSKEASLDLFMKKKPPASKRAPKRFVPRASFKKQTPEF